MSTSLEFSSNIAPADTSDMRVIKLFLDRASEQERVGNTYGRGFWTGRAIQHADQNAIETSWLEEEMSERGLGPVKEEA